jgi:hypothetical protein
MMWADALAKLRRELVKYIDAKVAGVAVWTRTANASKLGQEDAVETGDDDSNRGQRPVRRIEPFGFRSRPVAKQRSLSLRIGSSTVVYLGVASDGGYGPSDLEDGEVVIYSKNIPEGVRLKSSGDVALLSKDGQIVTVNGSNYSLLNTEDFLSGLDTFLEALSSTDLVLADAGTYVAPSPSIAAFRAALSSYKSTKAKHG